MTWLEEILQQHKELESPESFWRWSAIAALSAVVKDNVWLDQQIFKLYPNIYVMLHAESGLKKGPPVSMAKQLVSPVNNTKIISGRSSIQGILKDMGSGQTAPGGKIEMKSSAFICSSELSSSIVEDKVATTILTDLYDRSYNIGNWRSLLKMETFELKDPTITMLTATNEAMSEDFFTKSAIQGGYFARTFIIHEKDGAAINSLIYPLEFKPNYIGSAEYLKVIAQLRGPFKPLSSMEQCEEYRFRRTKGNRMVWFNEAGVLYDDWYIDFREWMKTQETKDETGTMNRFGTSVLKVAMLLSLAAKPELVITEAAMREAISQCERLLGNARKATLGKNGLSNIALLKTMVINELLNRDNNSISRAMLMKKYWMHYENSAEFDDMMASFDAAGMITSEARGNQLIYQMPAVHVEELKRFMMGKREKK